MSEQIADEYKNVYLWVAGKADKHRQYVYCLYGETPI